MVLGIVMAPFHEKGEEEEGEGGHNGLPSYCVNSYYETFT